ncbi:hypothetical protein ACWGI9_12285 [Streptomyces sp. NPDC054833]
MRPEATGPVPARDLRRRSNRRARKLKFTDPVTGAEHRFTSGRALEAWSSYGRWAGQ